MTWNMNHSFSKGWPRGTHRWVLGQPRQQWDCGQAGMKVFCGEKLSPYQ